ncbi:MAG: hypothetical protein ABIS29_05150 [Vicinamibacterales bacterium]
MLKLTRTKRAPSVEEGEPDLITAWQAAFIAEAEQRWMFAATPEAERARLRSQVVAHVQLVTAQLRAEHLGRTGAKP